MKTNRVIIAGGSGFLGQQLAKRFATQGSEVVILARDPALAGIAGRIVAWNGRTLGTWTRELEEAASVINLAGCTVNCRYTDRNRRQIMQSRLEPTQIIGEAISQCANPPKTWLNASTATIYRHTFGPAWDESGEIGATPEAKDGFSVEVATTWERALEESSTPHTRKIALRSAMVLGLADNSVLPTLRRLTRLGLGGRMGSGCQFVSWIHQDDFCRAVQFLLEHEDIRGSINLAAPQPLPNAEMMKRIRDVCGAPFGLPATHGMLEMGAFLLRTETELIIKSRRVVPGRLLAEGFRFDFPTFQEAIVDLIG